MMPPITGDSLCRPSEDIVARDIEGELIIIPLTAGIGDMEDDLFTLNETGRVIWERLDGVRSLHQISHEISETYAGNILDIERDVIGLVTELVRRKIVVLP